MSDVQIDPQQKLILEALQAMPAGEVYHLAPKAVVERGFSYYRQNRLESFEWGPGFSRLTARVRGTRLYAVSFTERNGKPVSSCTCPAWMEMSVCKHVVCAMATIKNLMQPALFRTPGEDRARRGALLRNLYTRRVHAYHPADPALPGGYAVVLERVGSLLDVFVRHDGERVSGVFSDVPAPLRSLLVGSAVVSRTSLLARYLMQHGNRFPLLYQDGPETLEVEFDEGLSGVSRTVFDARNNAIVISKRYDLSGVEEQNLVLFDDVVIDRAGRRVGLVGDTGGWEPWFSLRRDIEYLQRIPVLADLNDAVAGSSITVPLELFNSLQLSFAGAAPREISERLVLLHEGQPVAADPVQPSCRLAITPSDEPGDRLLLAAECRAGSLTLQPSFALFGFLEALQTSLPAAFRAKKRLAVIVQAFFDLMAGPTKTAAQKIIRVAAAECGFTTYARRRELRELLTRLYEASTCDHCQLHFHDGVWMAVPVEARKQAGLFRVPFELLGPAIFRDGPDFSVMAAPAATVIEVLPLLRERLAEQGIELFYKGRPVALSHWEFVIDASSAGDIDWFELRPEVRCDGRVVDPSWFLGRQGGKALIEGEDGIRLMDANTQAIVHRIALLHGAGAGSASRAREVVRVPRLRILDWLALRSRGVTVKLPPDDEAVLSRLMRFTALESRPLPETLAARLRPYQREGYDWLAFLYENRFGACLADDMGLGKTLQAISLLAGIKEGRVKSRADAAGHSHLVVVPPSLLFNWEHELRRFCPALTVRVYAGQERQADFSGCDVVLTTYGTVRRDISTLEKIPFDVIIFDEAQAVKNIHADQTAAVRRLRARFKLAMTGTPLENHLGEYYSIIDLALPGLLGEYDQFRPLIKGEASAGIELVLNRTRPFVLRRTKEAVLKDLPPKVETDIYLELTEDQKALYQRTVEEVRAVINDAYRSKTASQAKIIALTAILKLRQICVSPRLVAPALNGGSPKVEFLVQKLQELRDEGHSALVFSQFTSFLDIVEEGLAAGGLDFERLDGSTPVAKRKKLVKQFQSSAEPAIFLLSLKAGGQGLNLTKATYVFHLDPWWNPAVEDQASDRAHRIGQKRQVTITRILMKHTIEEKMMALKARKRALYEAIMSGTARRGPAITREDFEFLLSGTEEAPAATGQHAGGSAKTAGNSMRKRALNHSHT